MKIISNKQRLKLLNFLLHKVYKINIPESEKCRLLEGITPIHLVSSEWGEFKFVPPQPYGFLPGEAFFYQGA